VDGSEGPLSDAAADIARTGQQYAATNITIDPNALTGISNIDETTVALTRTLATVVDGLGVIAGMGAARYGTLVHTLFGTAVRLANFRGIGFFDVETTFSLEPDAYYGSKESVRTDVVLRNDAGEIIAIYDVKTGSRGLRTSRIRELRAQRPALGRMSRS
jgi:hypothetical protein